MASTKTLQDTAAWASPLFRFAPQEQGSLEPMLTSANMVKQMVLGPPFAWRWNRNAAAFYTVAGQQDYPVAIADFGYFERASFRDAAGEVFEVEEQGVLGDSAETSRPTTLAAQGDDNTGTVTLRSSPVPDAQYLVTLTYQRKPLPMTSLVSNWYPIPDELHYLVNLGYITFLAMFADDARFQTFSQRFVAHLLSAQDSITELSRNLFLANWTAVQSQAQRIQQQTAQGVQARGI